MILVLRRIIVNNAMNSAEHPGPLCRFTFQISVNVVALENQLWLGSKTYLI